MAKYKKRKDGRYQANIQIGYDEVNKRKIYKTIYAYSPSDLDNKKADIKSNLNKGTYADDKNMTVKDLAEKWYATEKATCGIRTKEMYERLTYKHIIPALGDKKIKDLKKSDVQLIINERADRHRTCQQLKMAIKQMLNFAIEDGLLYRNVGDNITLPHASKSEKRGLTEMEKQAIKKANFNNKEQAFIYTLLCTGIRRGEALALSRNDISIRSKTISIKNVVTFDKSTPILKSMPKTEAGIRTIPITEQLEEILFPYINALEGLYLFTNENGELMHKSTYDDFWRRILEKINVAAGGTATKKVNINANKSDENGKPLKPKYKEKKGLQVIHGLSAHVFRHNYATLLYYQDVPIKDAQYLLGHSNIKITLDIYTHLDQEKSNIAGRIGTMKAI